ncbi:MAG: ABC transporter ATP-binding protein [Clostridiales bacterium]|nr:ABC transporter ATP-binding protein [Clostridiales bacterium]
MEARKPLLEIRDLDIAFGRGKKAVQCADGVSLTVNAGEIVCVVGESGCGKSITALSVMGLLPRQGHVTGGSIRFDGRELLTLTEREMDKVRGRDMAMIFQDIMYSLNPVLTIGLQMTEGMQRHLGMTREAAQARAVQLLGKVGIPDPAGAMRRFPHQLSGGQRQRVMIAMALACGPKLLIADEPTTALDMTVQRQILLLLRQLRDEGLGVLLITHDVGVVAELADRVVVMYAGQCVEAADTQTLLTHPQHPYTQALMAAVPGIDDPKERRLYAIPGAVPERYDTMEGCRFAPRCPHAEGCGKQPGYDAEAAHPVRCERREDA